MEGPMRSIIKAIAFVVAACWLGSFLSDKSVTSKVSQIIPAVAAPGVERSAVATPSDERSASSPLLEAASKAMIEDEVFVYCRNYTDLTVCKMVTGNMVGLRDRPFDAGGCKAPHKRNSVKIREWTLYTCVMAVDAASTQGKRK
jgi:hypothetical protein